MDRRPLWLAQTPQAFRRAWLEEGHRRALLDGTHATDDADLVELIGRPVVVVEGSGENIKVTRPEDLVIGEAISAPRTSGKECRMTAYVWAVDGIFIHLVAGTQVDPGRTGDSAHKGLQGHSDSDALVHAICDALLGAMGEGDLGRHYPSSDQRYKNISSLKLLEDVVGKLRARGIVS